MPMAVMAESVNLFIKQVGSNVNRGSYDSAFDAGDVVYETRELIAELFNDTVPEQVVFTRNVTESLNLVIKGLLNPGDHVLVTSMEHNAVMRPLTGLRDLDISFSRIPCNREGLLQTAALENLLTFRTRAVVMTHASNVSGTIMDVDTVSAFCREHDLDLILDAAQTAGVLPIDVQIWNPAAVCFTGHKSLLGPQGTSGAWLSKNTASQLRPLVEGGTGSFSEDEVQPEKLPDKFEAGTLNMPGLYGLHAALLWLKKTGIQSVHAHEMMLAGRFMEKAGSIKQVELTGPQSLDQRTAVVSVVCPRHDHGEVAHRLAKEYGIATRSGMHCAPSAHKTLGTYPAGTVRFSFGCFNTLKEVDQAVNALWQIVKS
ncbi:MAG: aminotransferase class V-fold PLP-dependent enzyme [Bacillota bacterium]|nr:aminotransferase class V-fold PLP-dependent enzyme [Bacillota bacterium]